MPSLDTASLLKDNKIMDGQEFPSFTTAERAKLTVVKDHFPDKDTGSKPAEATQRTEMASSFPFLNDFFHGLGVDDGPDGEYFRHMSTIFQDGNGEAEASNKFKNEKYLTLRQAEQQYDPNPMNAVEKAENVLILGKQEQAQQIENTMQEKPWQERLLFNLEKLALYPPGNLDMRKDFDRKLLLMTALKDTFLLDKDAMSNISIGFNVLNQIPRYKKNLFGKTVENKLYRNKLNHMLVMLIDFIKNSSSPMSENPEDIAANILHNLTQQHILNPADAHDLDLLHRYQLKLPSSTE